MTSSQAEPAAPHSFEEQTAVRLVFAALSERDQQVLALRMAGLTNREIAATLGVSEDAAAMACFRALQRLKKQIGHE